MNMKVCFVGGSGRKTHEGHKSINMKVCFVEIFGQEKKNAMHYKEAKQYFMKVCFVENFGQEKK